MTTADCSKDGLVDLVKQEILAKFKSAVLDSSLLSFTDYGLLLHASREEGDADFLAKLRMLLQQKMGHWQKNTPSFTQPFLSAASHPDWCEI